MPENIQKIIKNILRDIQVELTDEFDQNFERQAFFSEPWQRRKSPIRDKGRAILTDTGQLRRSIKSKTTENSVIFYTDLPYAEIHNEGGEIIVTQRMKRFFWHKYYEATGAFSRKKSGKTGKTATAGNHEADFWHRNEHPGEHLWRPARSILCKRGGIIHIVSDILRQRTPKYRNVSSGINPYEA